MNGSAFLFVLLVGVALDRLWLNREAFGAWLEALLDDPTPAEPLAPPRSHVRQLPSSDGPEAA